MVPFVFALIERGGDLTAYWIVDRKPKRATRLQRLLNLERHTAVEFVVDGYGEDWRTLWWVRASGRGRVVSDDAERSSALAALRGKYPQYEDAHDAGPVVAIDLDRISGWSASGDSEVGRTR